MQKNQTFNWWIFFIWSIKRKIGVTECPSFLNQAKAAPSLFLLLLSVLSLSALWQVNLHAQWGCTETISKALAYHWREVLQNVPWIRAHSWAGAHDMIHNIKRFPSSQTREWNKYSLSLKWVFLSKLYFQLPQNVIWTNERTYMIRYICKRPKISLPYLFSKHGA